MITNQLTQEELDRIDILFVEGFSLEYIAHFCVAEKSTSKEPCRQGVRSYLDQSNLWPKGTPRIKPCSVDKYGNPDKWIVYNHIFKTWNQAAYYVTTVIKS